MSGPDACRLFIALQPSYAGLLEELCQKFATYRPEEGIEWRSRIEAWLSNFDGLVDQLLAMSMLRKLHVVTYQDAVTACDGLRRRISGDLPDDTRLHHFAHETSGALLLRVLEKKLRVRAYQLLKPSDFHRIEEVEKLRDGDAVVIWDMFNGTGEQAQGLAKKYQAIFAGLKSKSAVPVHFAFVAGRVEPSDFPSGVRVHSWIPDVPVMSSEESDFAARYAERMGKLKATQKYETGALITFIDNPPNNIPLILRAPASESWFTLLDREETARP